MSYKLGERKAIHKVSGQLTNPISDDEDDTHPNIDTPSLFRWRHQARVERMAEFENEKKALETKKKIHLQKVKEIKEKISASDGNLASLQSSLDELELKGVEIEKEEIEFKKKEKQMPWNVDTISKPGFAKTIINKDPEPKKDGDLTEEERQEQMKKFVKENDKLVKKFGMLGKYEDSNDFLTTHHHLICENSANCLVLWCLDLEMEGKTKLMEHVSHQFICLQFILELAKTMNVDPRACVTTFFKQIKNAPPDYKMHFDNEVEAFKQRIKNRAAEKIQEAEEEERKARLGPGGLDPVEVMETLPEVLQNCFLSRDIGALQQAILTLPEEEAKLHMKRCVDSGLWLPDGGKEESTSGIIEDEEAISSNDTKDNEASSSS